MVTAIDMNISGRSHIAMDTELAESEVADNTDVMDKRCLSADGGNVAVCRDVATVSIINGLNFLINKANDMGLYGALRSLNAAKEDLVYWAVEMNFHETLEEKFVNKCLYGSNIVDIEDLKAYMSEGRVVNR